MAERNPKDMTAECGDGGHRNERNGPKELGLSADYGYCVWSEPAVPMG